MTVDRITARLDELRALAPGWLDGEGVPPTPAALTAAEHIARIIAACDQTPRIYPTPEGGATVECEPVDVCVGADGRIADTTETVATEGP